MEPLALCAAWLALSVIASPLIGAWLGRTRAQGCEGDGGKVEDTEGQQA